jgi:hypothetical protein
MVSQSIINPSFPFEYVLANTLQLALRSSTTFRRRHVLRRNPGIRGSDQDATVLALATLFPRFGAHVKVLWLLAGSIPYFDDTLLLRVKADCIGGLLADGPLKTIRSA